MVAHGKHAPAVKSRRIIQDSVQNAGLVMKEHRLKKRRALRRLRWLRRYGPIMAGLSVGALLALCQAVWAQISSPPMLGLAFGANMALGAWFGRAWLLMRGTPHTEWRLMPQGGMTLAAESDWTPPPAPHIPVLPASYRESRAFVHAHIYGASDLLTLLRARQAAGDGPLGERALVVPSLSSDAVIQS